MFFEAEVADHARALDSLQRWQRLAQGGELRTALATATAKVQVHLVRARAL